MGKEHDRVPRGVRVAVGLICSLLTDHVLTDTEWKELLDNPEAPDAPQLPEWLKPILVK